MDREEIISILRTADKAVDGILTKRKYDDYRSENQPASSTISYHIQWNDIKREADLAISPASGDVLSETDAVEALTIVNQRVDGTLTFEKYNEYRDATHPSAGRISEHIGWNTAKRSANLELANDPREQLEKNQAKAALRAVAPPIDGPLTVEAYEDHRNEDQPHGVAIARKYGWNNLKAEIGLETDARGSGTE